MNQTPNSDGRTEAERWYARLKSPQCTASERMEFQRWHAVREHAAAYAATEKLWQSLGQLAQRPDLEQLSQQILADTAQQPRSAWLRMTIAAAILIALIGSGVFWAMGYRESPTIAYATQPGERSTIKLADGSELILNFATELDIQMNRRVRRLTLRQGEALFTVAHERRPFKVTAGDGEVTALGTRFLVRNEAKQVAVTLLEGRVAVERPAQKQHVQLEAGGQVRFTEAVAGMKQRTIDPQVVSSWTVGRLLFRSTPLSEALVEVNRYSTTKIRIGDPALAGVPISGTFELGDADSIVAALERLLPVRAITAGEREILLQRR
jgi:transmembrane sensor